MDSDHYLLMSKFIMPTTWKTYLKKVSITEEMYKSRLLKDNSDKYFYETKISHYTAIILPSDSNDLEWENIKHIKSQWEISVWKRKLDCRRKGLRI